MYRGMRKEARSVLIASITPAGSDGNPMQIDGYDTAPHKKVKGGVSNGLGLPKACDIVID